MIWRGEATCHLWWVIRHATDVDSPEGGASFVCNPDMAVFPVWYEILGFLSIVSVACFLLWAIRHATRMEPPESSASLQDIQGDHLPLSEKWSHSSWMTEVYDVSKEMLSNWLMDKIIHYSPWKWHGYDGKDGVASLVWSVHVTKVHLSNQNELTQIRKKLPQEKGMQMQTSTLASDVVEKMK